jgi:hypothetical protein
VIFRLFPWRFRFIAQESIYFPEGKSGNILRGAFGTILRKSGSESEYARIFAPVVQGSGPSGLADSPRPFVLRAMHLDGRTVRVGQPFDFDLHVFDTWDSLLPLFVNAFGSIVTEGLGPRRGRANLESVWQLSRCGEPAYRVFDGTKLFPHDPLVLDLTGQETDVHNLRVRFQSPTELKSGSDLVTRPEFHILFARARDRVSTLRTLYGEGPLDLDFRAMGTRASTVQMIRCEIRHVDIVRRSSRTGQVHPISGFIGDAEYEGELTEFVPILSAAQWTGVGRQTVWGKGAIEIR